MTPEQILEIARRYGNSDLRWVPVFENDEDIGISKREYVWEISQDSLIAFAQSVLEEEQEKYQELIAAAEAVIYRWDSPLWKDAEPTAAVICKLRCALESLKEEVE